MLNACESNENVYFGGKRGVVDYSHLGYPYNIDRSEQETTTELWGSLGSFPRRKTKTKW